MNTSLIEHCEHQRQVLLESRPETSREISL